MANKISLALIPLIVFLLCSCANDPFSSYKTTSDKQLNRIYAGKSHTAMKAESTSDPLFNMEYGSLLRMDQNYNKSNYYYSLAEQSIQVWANSWMSTTGGQAANTTVAMLLNDNATEYQPRGYERSFLATYHALNHLDLNNWQDARIEIKRMYQIEQATKNYNQRLYAKETEESNQLSKDKNKNYIASEVLKHYDFKDIGSPKVLALKNSYQNAFSHYLAGFVFEALNDPSLARPGYVNAGQLNPTNTLIQQSITNLDNNVRPKPQTTDLLIVEETGHAPQIKSEQVSAPFNANLAGGNNSCMGVINIFYPRLIPDKLNTTVYPYLLDNESQTPMLMTDVDLMAARSIYDQIPHIIARNVAAVVRNIATSQLACNGDTASALISLGLDITETLLDRADERIWTLLPSKVYINRINLPYGKHTITVYVNGIPFSYQVNLNGPYQILNFRVFGNHVFFNPQR